MSNLLIATGIVVAVYIIIRNLCGWICSLNYQNGLPDIKEVEPDGYQTDAEKRE